MAVIYRHFNQAHRGACITSQSWGLDQLRPSRLEASHTLNMKLLVQVVISWLLEESLIVELLQFAQQGDSSCSLSLGKCWGHRSASHQVNLSLWEECLQQWASMMRPMDLSWEKKKSHCICGTGPRAGEDNVQASADWQASRPWEMLI